MSSFAYRYLWCLLRENCIFFTNMMFFYKKFKCRPVRCRPFWPKNGAVFQVSPCILSNKSLACPYRPRFGLKNNHFPEISLLLFFEFSCGHPNCRIFISCILFVAPIRISYKHPPRLIAPKFPFPIRQTFSTPLRQNSIRPLVNKFSIWYSSPFWHRITPDPVDRF